MNIFIFACGWSILSTIADLGRKAERVCTFYEKKQTICELEEIISLNGSIYTLKRLALSFSWSFVMIGYTFDDETDY